jgi:MFS family permease
LAYVAGRWGWRSVFLVTAGISLALALADWLVVRDEPRSGKGRSGEPAADWRVYRECAAQTLRNRSIWTISICGFGKYGPLMAYQGLWGAMFLMGVYGLAKMAAGNVLMVISIGYALGGPLLGFLSDRVLHSRKLVLGPGTTLFALAWLPLLLWPGQLSMFQLYLISGIMGVAGGGTAVLIFSIAKESVAPELSGMAIALANTASFAAVVVFQPLTGWLISRTEPLAKVNPAAPYQSAFLVCALGAALAAVASWFVKETLGQVKQPSQGVIEGR